LPLKPFNTGVPVFATFTPAGPVLATTALAGRLVCMSFAGATGDGCIEAATAKVGVVGDVTGGISGAGTAAAGSAPGAGVCASGGTGTPATFAALDEESDATLPCSFIDEPVSDDVVSADAVVSSVED
jgi:hypothetical protein